MNYKFYSKLMHLLCLESCLIKKMSFDLECFIFGNKVKDRRQQQHVFISGLPRSGSTALLLQIYSTKKFASLTYRDMPFVMAPNIGSKILPSKNLTKSIRAHDDGIHIDLNSPEAFDHIFTSTLLEENSHPCDNEKKVIDYINLILLKYNKTRYLSKNNNNSNIWNLIVNCFPNALILVPFRNPIEQANSMQKQHLHFDVLHEEDPFSKKYMELLNHTEFGKLHQSWNAPINFFKTCDINYWLEQWVIYYQNIHGLCSKNARLIPISYEVMCDSDQKFQRFKLLLNLPLNTKKILYNKNRAPVLADEKLSASALKIYDKLVEQFNARV